MSDFRHSDIQLGGFAVHVAELGDPAAQPILFLHGWPQSWTQWQQVMELAGDEFRAVAIDLPGVGQSAGTATDGSKQALAGVVHGLIERLRLDRPVIVGHDVGGMIAYSYLRRYQDAGRRRHRRRGHPRARPVGGGHRQPLPVAFRVPHDPRPARTARAGPPGPLLRLLLRRASRRPGADYTPGPGRLRAGVRLRRGTHSRVRLLPRVRARCRRQPCRDRRDHRHAGALRARGGQPREHRQLRTGPAGRGNPAGGHRARPGRRALRRRGTAPAAMAARARVHHQQSRGQPPIQSSGGTHERAASTDDRPVDGQSRGVDQVLHARPSASR